MRIADLAGRRVALWGWGHEGRAAYHALRARLSAQALTLFCDPAEAAQAAALGDPHLAVETEASGERLATFEVVVKSPGISPYRLEAAFAAEHGTRFLGGTALWLAERADDDGAIANMLCVTGTKGKSTTTALLAHLLRVAGLRTALAGNIGLPLLELLDAQAQAWAIELSSYQTRDVAASGARPQVAIVTNLHPEHLDWHGSEERYIADKLALVTQAKPRIAVLNAADPRLAALALPGSEIRWYGDARGWHLRGDALYRGDVPVMDTAHLPLPGRHNRSNLCAVLTALEAFGLDAAALAPQAAAFQPLPHRLQPLGARDGWLYVNDSISTTPMATLAALEVYADRPVAVLVGGHDRGLPWDAFAAAMRTRAPRAVVTLGQNGPRIHALLAPLAVQAGFALEAASDLEEAIGKARAALPAGGVVLLSPGAPSFDAYPNYVARGRHFAQLAGFDPEAISGIAGLGIA
ncbi:UDP-N-acetylmuramoyl-L-alanine--D-glutamate ligase [Thermomonas sp.]|uniref:UDP-N-acetylmuramoyl-L-alanine--D-glutamate ligase n=1 Tax=Thermomonas sp. TaxID=1971895 RepID=UPI001ACA0BFB|nr:UDP-N-acetylmuramoyl-L-alanine--D-glutamate ligase [Xanthomonadales bacterium]MBN8794612.1 UDP-N-acetylmuramoyl-L-alanine--D-glutamate ligase [Stenotrophomonas nitritireducens]